MKQSSIFYAANNWNGKNIGSKRYKIIKGNQRKQSRIALKILGKIRESSPEILVATLYYYAECANLSIN